MLTLALDVGESITIGDDIRVVLLHKYGRRGVIAIEAPKDVEIKRAEPVPPKAQKRKVVSNG